jgi:hypothetical protein
VHSTVFSQQHMIAERNIIFVISRILLIILNREVTSELKNPYMPSVAIDRHDRT